MVETRVFETGPFRRVFVAVKDSLLESQGNLFVEVDVRTPGTLEVDVYTPRTLEVDVYTPGRTSVVDPFLRDVPWIYDGDLCLQGFVVTRSGAVILGPLGDRSSGGTSPLGSVEEGQPPGV